MLYVMTCDVCKCTHARHGGGKASLAGLGPFLGFDAVVDGRLEGLLERVDSRLALHFDLHRSRVNVSERACGTSWCCLAA